MAGKCDDGDYFLNPTQQMMSAGAGSLVVSLFMTPLDVVKIRLQAQERFHAKKCFLYSNGLMDHLCPRTNGDPPARALHTAQEICDCKWYNRPKYFNGTLDAMLKISRLEGVSSLWSGLSPTLGRYLTSQSLELSCCNYCHFQYSQSPPQSPISQCTSSSR